MFSDADWLEVVTTSRQPSPNHDLCCRLLSHIPLLAAYTGWPTENQLRVHSQAGTQLFQTADGNEVTGRANSDVAETGLSSEDEVKKWRPTEEEKRYIEETVKQLLIDREDLCRLLMIAMATELERPTTSEHEDETVNDGKLLRHVVQCSVDASSGDHDHGDTTFDEDTKHERPNGTQEFRMTRVQTNSPALGDLGDQLTENVRYDLKSAVDSDDFRASEIVFEDAKCDSRESASSTPSPTNSAPLIPLQETFSDHTSTAWFSQKSCDESITLDVELADAIRKTENAKMIEFEQANSNPSSQTPDNLSQRPDRAQTVDTSNSYSVLPPPSTDVQSGMELGLPSTSCTVKELCTYMYDISTTEPRQFIDFHSEKEKKRVVDRCDHDDSVKTTFDYRSTINRNSPTGGGHDAEKSIETDEIQSTRRTGRLEDDCRVAFKPRRQALPVPVRTNNRVNPVQTSAPPLRRTTSAVNHAPASASSTRPLDANSSRTPARSATSTGRKPASTAHDVKCAARRKNVAV